MKSIFYYLAGLSILKLNKLKSAIKGSTSPKPILPEDIRIIPLQTVDRKKRNHTLRGLNHSFKEYDMSILECMILATKK